MEQFFTWSNLATYAGAVVLTALVTQIFKNVGFIKRISTRLFSYIVALIILLLAAWFTGTLSISVGIMAALKALVVGLASNGAYAMSQTAKVRK